MKISLSTMVVVYELFWGLKFHRFFLVVISFDILLVVGFKYLVFKKRFLIIAIILSMVCVGIFYCYFFIIFPIKVFGSLEIIFGIDSIIMDIGILHVIFVSMILLLVVVGSIAVILLNLFLFLSVSLAKKSIIFLESVL